MGLAFFPRGGSAHVARNLATALPAAGWDVTVLSGSLTRPGGAGDAREFYAGLDVRPVDLTAAFEAADPMAADPPMHPSYEEREGSPRAMPHSVATPSTRAWRRAAARRAASPAASS